MPSLNQRELPFVKECANQESHHHLLTLRCGEVSHCVRCEVLRRCRKVKRSVPLTPADTALAEASFTRKAHCACRQAHFVKKSRSRDLLFLAEKEGFGLAARRRSVRARSDRPPDGHSLRARSNPSIFMQKQQKRRMGAFIVFGEEHEFNTKCTRSTCFRLFRLLCAHPRLFPFVPCESVNILFT